MRTASAFTLSIAKGTPLLLGRGAARAADARRRLQFRPDLVVEILLVASTSSSATSASTTTASRRRCPPRMQGRLRSSAGAGERPRSARTPWTTTDPGVVVVARARDQDLRDAVIAYECSRNLLDHQIWATL